MVDLTKHNQPKDADNEYAVDCAWQETIAHIVMAFCQDDFELVKHTIVGVERPDRDIASHNREYVADYGEKLIPLTHDVWDRAAVLWQEGYWELMIDLCTTAGISDMVLKLTAHENNNKLQFSVGLIYVP